MSWYASPRNLPSLVREVETTAAQRHAMSASLGRAGNQFLGGRHARRQQTNRSLIRVVLDQPHLMQLLQHVPAERWWAGVLQPSDQICLGYVARLGEHQHQGLLLPGHARPYDPLLVPVRPDQRDLTLDETVDDGRGVLRGKRGA